MKKIHNSAAVYALFSLSFMISGGDVLAQDSNIPTSKTENGEEVRLTEVNVSIRAVNFELDELFQNTDFDVELIFEENNSKTTATSSEVLRIPLVKNTDNTYSTITNVQDYDVLVTHSEYDFAKTGNNYAQNTAYFANESTGDRKSADFLNLISYSAISKDRSNLKTNEREQHQGLYREFLSEKTIEAKYSDPSKYHQMKQLLIYHDSLNNNESTPNKLDIQGLVNAHILLGNEKFDQNTKDKVEEQYETLISTVSRETFQNLDSITSQTLVTKLLQPNGMPAAQELTEVYIGRSHLTIDPESVDSFFGASDGIWDRRRSDSDGLVEFPFVPMEGIARIRGGVGTFLETPSNLIDLKKTPMESVLQLLEPDKQISGFIFSEYEPLENATVVIEDAEGNNIAETSTNKHGQFTLPLFRKNPDKIKILMWQKSGGFKTLASKIPIDYQPTDDLYFDISTMKTENTE